MKDSRVVKVESSFHPDTIRVYKESCVAKFPDVSQASAEDLIKIIFANAKEASEGTADENTFDITVNVAILRRVKELIK